MNSRISVNNGGVLLNSTRRTTSCNSSMFVVCANTPRGAQEGDISRVGVPRKVSCVTGRNLIRLIIRTPCVVGLTGAAGPSRFRFTVKFLHRRVIQTRTLNTGRVALRPNSRINTNSRVNVGRVVGNLGRILRPDRATRVTLRAVTKGNARVNQAFRRLTTVVSKMIRGSGLSIALSAYRAGSTNCGIGRSFSNILRRFSHVVNLRHLGVVRIGSSGGREKTRGSERTGVKFNAVNFRALGGVIRRPRLRSLPGVLRAPFINRSGGGGGTPCEFRLSVLGSRAFGPNLLRSVLGRWRVRL